LQTRETRIWGAVSVRRMPPPRPSLPAGSGERGPTASPCTSPRADRKILPRDRASKGSRFPSPRGVGSSPGRCATVAGGRGARRRPPPGGWVPGQEPGFPAPERGGVAVAVSTITAASTSYDNPTTWFCTGALRRSRSRPCPRRRRETPRASWLLVRERGSCHQRGCRSRPPLHRKTS
jgi:hypothetical protein